MDCHLNLSHTLYTQTDVQCKMDCHLHLSHTLYTQTDLRVSQKSTCGAANLSARSTNGSYTCQEAQDFLCFLACA